MEEKKSTEEIKKEENQEVKHFVLTRKAKILCFLLILVVLIVFFIILFLQNNKNNTKTEPMFSESMPVEKMENYFLKISTDKKIINIGEICEIKIETENDVVDEIRWESSAPEIISVVDGKITGIMPGKVKIYGYLGEIQSNELEVECIKKIDNIVIDKTELKVELGKTDTINVKIIPEDATYKELTWISSDENIAKVENGIVTAINIGKCEIKAIDYTNTFNLLCKVEVTPIEVSELALDETNVTIGTGQKYLLLSTITPSNASNKNITWSSSNSNVIKVDKGNITAVGTGNAVVTITSSNGVKATCNFSVIPSSPTYEIKYGKNQYNIRSGPGTNYSKLTMISKNDELQILKIVNGWAKVRTPNGTVGFIISSAYSSSRSYFISNVPYINQFKLGYPTGCEAVSAAMAAQYSGYNVSPATLIQNTPTDERGIWRETITVTVSQAKLIKMAMGEVDSTLDVTENVVNNIIDNTINNVVDNTVDNVVENTVNNIVNNTVNNVVNDSNVNNTVNNIIENTTNNTINNNETIPEKESEIKTETKEVIYGGDPFKVFVGHPTKKLNQGSYGCFAGPIVAALNKSGVPCTNISNCSQDTLLGYIRQGKPVVVWCVKNAGNLIVEETWQYPDGSGSYTKLKGEHCAVLIGYDDEYVYLNDPSAGKNVKQPRGKFFSNWNQLYCQAIIIN